MTSPVVGRPDWVIQVAFNADPNDSAAIPVWTDVTSMVLGAGAIARGRQYELAQSQAAQPTVVFRDVNEYLNPANTTSPYYPNVQPYRQILWQGQWPNVGTGATGNLLNTGAWLIQVDPTFESYPTGTPNSFYLWVTTVNGTTPIVADARY